VRLRRRSNDLPPVSLRLKVLGAVHRALAAYADYCAYEDGKPVDLPNLVIEIVSVNRGFRGWRANGRASSPASASTGSEDEAGSR
jgi:hypothetical protein